MTLRSRINQRTAHRIAVAERAPANRKSSLDDSHASESAAFTVPTHEATPAPTPTPSPTPAPEPVGAGAIWDVPGTLTLCAPPLARASSATKTPTRRSTLAARRKRPAVVCTPVDWSAVRAYSAS